MPPKLHCRPKAARKHRNQTNENNQSPRNSVLNSGAETLIFAEPVHVRTEGALDEDSLQIFAIARVPDPFGRTSGGAPLPINQPVTGAIRGRVLADVYVVPRNDRILPGTTDTT